MADLDDTRDLLSRLEGVYGSLPEDFLWDTSSVQTLPHPSIHLSRNCLSDHYCYIGRARAKELYQLVRSLRRGNVLQIQGATGSGKSTVVSSIAGFMLGKLKARVVYISAANFIEDPLKVLRDGLLSATRGDKLVARIASLERLCEWCEAQRRETMLFLIDDWDELHDYPDAESLLTKATTYHIRVKLTSTSSRDRHICSTSDKPLPAFDFDGPYTREELETWIAQSSLSRTKLRALDCLTGGMPGLLGFYEDVQGHGKAFREAIEEGYGRKLFETLIKGQLCAALELVTTGVRGTHLRSPVDLACFYKNGNKCLLMSPYLRWRAECYVMEQQHELGNALQLKDIQQWSDAVKLDCIVKGRNPARVGWNVEGLVVSVMRYQGKLWDGLEFEHFKTFERGCEAVLLKKLAREELTCGVLAAPIAFNDKALDIIYLRLLDDALQIKAVQITVSKWKHKKRKKSHIVWLEQVLPGWLAEEWTLEHQFVYLMPDTLSKEELGELDSDLKNYIDACRQPAATPGSSESEDDEDDVGDDGSANGRAVYEVDMEKVRSEEILLKRFGSVHACLARLDKLVRLHEPPKLDKKPIKTCSGNVLLEDGSYRRCQRRRRTDEEIYYCCESHKVL